MNVSNVTSAMAQWQSPAGTELSQRTQDFKALSSALQSGDLTGAQQAFASLQSDLQKTPQAATTATNAASQTNQFGKDFQALQSALQSGDLSGAQTAFATLKQDLKSSSAAKGAHHHHHHQSSGGTSPVGTQSSATATALTNGAPSASSIVSSLLNTQA